MNPGGRFARKASTPSAKSSVANAADWAKAFGFYAELFGWKIEDVPPGPIPYKMVNQGEGQAIRGGICAEMEGHSYVTVYVGVDDIQAYVEKATALGARFVVPITTVPGMVTLAMFLDPEDHLIGLLDNKRVS